MQPNYRGPSGTGNLYGNPYGGYPNAGGMGGMAGAMPNNMGMANQPVLDRGTLGYSNATLGMMVQKGGNMAAPGTTNLSPQQLLQEKDRQIQQLKTQFSNVQHKQVMNQGQPVDLVELSMQIQTPDAHLQVPMAILFDSRFPTVAPKIFIRSKLKHNLFESKDQTIEFDANNIAQWNQGSNITEVLNKAKAIFERDPPKQEKIIEDVNKLLSVVSEQNFKNLVVADHFSQRSVDELKLLQGISFQELICSSTEYKKIGQNLIDVVNFNEKVANELLQKKEDLEQHKRSLLQVSANIEGLTRDYNERANRCKGFKDAFSRQNIDAFVGQEIKNLDSQSLNLESIAQNQHGNILDICQHYLDTRKNYHRLNIVKMKLPELNYQ